jgi:hypothetical protein
LAIILVLIPYATLVNAQCTRCLDTGKIVCSYCKGSGEVSTGEPIGTCEYCGGLGVVQATITKKSAYSQFGDKEVHVSGIFENDESIGVYGVVIAEVIGQTSTFSDESERIYFPPNEEIEVKVAVGDFPIDDWDWIRQFGNLKTNIYISEKDSLVCPLCDGDGIITQMTDCTYCSGSGFVDCPDCDLNLGFGEGSGITILGIVAIIGLVLGSFIILKMKKTSESDLRKLSFYELQNWVVEKFSGNVSSVRDSRIGIDGYTVDGEPIQIKQSDDIGKNDVYRFANELNKKKTRSGIIVAFSFKEDVFSGIIEAIKNYRITIKTITIKELIYGKSP